MCSLIQRFSSKVAGDWFRASESAGDSMGIRYGRVMEGSSEIEWHSVSHIDCDGIGGFVRLLRARGVQISKLPETKHSSRGVILPLWNLWRAGRREEKCAQRTDWIPSGDQVKIPEAVAWHLFTKEETLKIMNRCREMGVTVNCFLLKKLDQAARPAVANPEARIRWVIPVNLRGDIQYKDDTSNHVSCVEVCIASGDSMEVIQADILHRLKRGEHRANYLLFIAGGLLSHKLKVDFLRKEHAKLNGNIGSFSNLGFWDCGDFSSDGWVFCPPVISGQLLGAGCVTFQGCLGIAIQSNISAPAEVRGWMIRLLDLIRENC